MSILESSHIHIEVFSLLPLVNIGIMHAYHVTPHVLCEFLLVLFVISSLKLHYIIAQQLFFSFPNI